MAKVYKSTKVNYYQLRVNTSKMTALEVDNLKEKFKNAILFKSLKVPIVEQGDGTVSPAKSKEINVRYVAGALIYTQKSNIPPKFDETSQKLEAVDIKGFSGLGYDSTFFYDSETMIIAIESKVPGPTLESFQNILNRNYKLDFFEIVVVTSSNDYQKFINSKGVRTVEIKMLNLSNVPAKKTKIKAVSEVQDLVDDLSGNYIDLKISVGQNRDEFLDFPILKRFADYAVKSIGMKNEVTKFKVDIVDLNSGKIDPIDLITNRIFDTLKIEKVVTISAFSITEKINQMEEFYLKRRPQLESAYKL